MADRQQLIDYLRSSQPKGLERFAVEDAPDDRFVEDLLALREGVTQDRMAREEATRRQDPNVQIRELLDVGLGGNQQVATPEDVTQEPATPTSADLMDMLTSRGKILRLGRGDVLPEDFGRGFSKAAPGTADVAAERYGRTITEGRPANARAQLENLIARRDTESQVKQQAVASLAAMQNQEIEQGGREQLAQAQAQQKQREAQDEAIGKVFSDFLKRKGQADEDPSSTKSILSQLPEDMRKQLINRPDRDAILKSFRDTKLMEESLGLVDPETQAALKELPQFKAVLGSLTSRVSELDKRTPAAAGATATDSGMSAGEMLLMLGAAAAAGVAGKKGIAAFKNKKLAKAAAEATAKGEMIPLRPGTSEDLATPIKEAFLEARRGSVTPTGISRSEDLATPLKESFKEQRRRLLAQEGQMAGRDVLAGVFDKPRAAARVVPEGPPDPREILQGVFDELRASKKGGKARSSKETERIIRGLYDQIKPRI